VLNFDSGVGRIEARGTVLFHTVAANTPNQIRGGGVLNKTGNGSLLIGAANPNFTGSATLSGGILDLRDHAAINHRPITLRGGRLSLRSDTDTDFVSSITIAPPEIANPAVGPSTTIYVDRAAAGSGGTHRLGDTTVGMGLELNILGNNGYGLALDSLSNAGRIDTAVPLTISGPVTLNGASSPAFSGTIQGSGNVFADGGMTVTTLGRRAGTGLLRVTGALTIEPGARLDTTTTDLLVDYTGASPADSLRDLVRQGRDTGIGIVSLGTPSNTVLAIVDNADWRQDEFRGLSIDLSTVVGKYTYYGDANLDGKVTGDDYVSIDSNLGTGDSWLQGDFTLDGAVTGDDYVAIDANLGAGSADPLAFAELKAQMVALHAEQFGPAYLVMLAEAEANGFASVPEPSMGWTFAAAALALRRRRAAR
jgi:autotransporter-associated beta strand protein